MWWYVLTSLMSDSRVRFLLLFVVVAIIVAAILIFVEIDLKRKRDRVLTSRAIKSPIEKIKFFLKNDKPLREKLDFIDKTAKKYFKDIYGTHLISNYSELILYFEKHHRKNEADFCRKMFDAYYAHEEVDNGRIRALGKMLMDIEIRRSIDEDNSTSPTIIGRILRIFGLWKTLMYVKNKSERDNNPVKHHLLSAVKKRKGRKNITKKVVAKTQKISVVKNHKHNKVKLIRPNNISKSHHNELFDISKIIGKIKSFFNYNKFFGAGLKKYKSLEVKEQKIREWVMEAIMKKYSREEVSSLLNNGKRAIKEINHILKIYDNEVGKIHKLSNINSKSVKTNNDKSAGVAERIIKRERRRLEDGILSIDPGAS